MGKKKTTGKRNAKNKLKNTAVTRNSTNSNLESISLAENNMTVSKNISQQIETTAKNNKKSKTSSQQINTSVSSNIVSPTNTIKSENASQQSRTSFNNNTTSPTNTTESEHCSTPPNHTLKSRDIHEGNSTSSIELHKNTSTRNNNWFENNSKNNLNTEKNTPSHSTAPENNISPASYESVQYNSAESSTNIARGTKRKRGQQDYIDLNDNDIPPMSVLIKQMEPQHPSRLFYKIVTEKETNAVQCWLVDYRINKENALRDIYQLFIDLASFQHINVNAYLDTGLYELQDIVKYMISKKNIVTMATQKYFLFFQNKSYIKKRERIENFIELFVEKCAREKIIYDFYLFKKIMNFIVLLCSCEMRSIRHTGVYLGLKFQTGLVKVEYLIILKVYKIQKALEEETNEINIEQMNTKIGKLKNYDAEINKMISYLQLYVFSSNWNLRHPKLGNMRIECLEELYKWIQIFPGRHLHYQNLSYFMKAMTTDQDKKVRYKAIEIIGNIVENHHEILENRIPKLIDSLELKIRDKDVKVAALAVATLNKIRKYIKLPSSVREYLCKYLFAPRYTVAAACGKYLADLMIEKNKDNSDEGLVRILIHFEMKCNQKNIQNYHYYLIDSLFDFLPIFTNIKPFINIYNNNEMDDQLTSIWVKLTAEVLRITFFGKCSLRRKKESRKPRIVNQSIAYQMFKDMVYFVSEIKGSNGDNINLMKPILDQLQEYKSKYLNQSVSSLERNSAGPNNNNYSN